MLTLAFDTSTSQGGVAVTRGESVLSKATWPREKSHNEFLTPTIENCLAEAGVAGKDLDLIAVGQGPGSFTGIRIAINAARSLAFALSKPVMAYDTLEILAAGAPHSDHPLLALVNAHKNMLYAAIFHWRDGHWTRQSQTEALTLDQIAARVTSPHLCLGDGFEEYETVLSQDLRRLLIRDQAISDYPAPEVLGRMASLKVGDVQPIGWKELQALYIRASGAEETLRETQQRDTSKKK